MHAKLLPTSYLTKLCHAMPLPKRQTIECRLQHRDCAPCVNCMLKTLFPGHTLFAWFSEKVSRNLTYTDHIVVGRQFSHQLFSGIQLGIPSGSRASNSFSLAFFSLTIALTNAGENTLSHLLNNPCYTPYKEMPGILDSIE